MKSGLLTLFIVFSLFFVACSKKEVVKVDNVEEPETTTGSPVTTETTTPTGDVVAVKCTDTDASDIYTSGKVTIKYSDGSEKDFVDDCPAKSNVQVEYICQGNNVASKNTICTQICVAGLCLE